MMKEDIEEVKPVGVIGSGSFGITVATLLAVNSRVLLYTRREDVYQQINVDRYYKDIKINERISATHDLEMICEECDLIFPIIPSSSFRSVLKNMSAYLKPHHILIHGTKGLDVSLITPEDLASRNFTRKDVYSMSEVILGETAVLRVGCISGPNLAKEILQGQPAATVIASEYQEVIDKGIEVLSGPSFFVFGSYDLKGAELAGAFKNIIAIGSGILAGLGFGKNMQALIITRGLREMIQFGESVGASNRSFLGTAGIGDLVATATSEKSRNHSFGYRLGQGESMKEILDDMDETVEGVNTLNIVHRLALNENINLTITSMLYKILFEGYDTRRALNYLMSFNYAPDVDFI